MTDPIYEALIDALDRLPNGFPRTSSRVELRLLKKLFAPDEASLATNLTRHYETVDVIARKAGLAPDEVKGRLVALARRGLTWCEKRDTALLFRLAPFVVGIYEAQLENMDHEFAHLFEEYMAAGGAQGIMTPSPALHRVLPASGTVKTEWILPYEDVKAMLKEGKVFSVRDCICRVQQDALSKRRCTFPLRNCLGFSKIERAPKPGDISRAEALAILDETEKIGLVHTVSNLRTGVFYVCNCCGCCCGILRGITDWGIENSVARANYFAVIDDRLCTQCGLCADRCQIKAITKQSDQTAVDRSRCIGCGLCVSACPNEAIRLEPRPDAAKIHPPENFARWEQLRLANRGIIG